MKLVDESLKKVFEKANITNFVKALAHLSNSECYTVLESFSNALYYFDVKDVNEYDLMIAERSYYDDEEGYGIYDVFFYKLSHNKHLEDYIGFCNTHHHNVERSAYDLKTVATMSQPSVEYIQTFFEGSYREQEYYETDHEHENDAMYLGEEEIMMPDAEYIAQPMPVARRIEPEVGDRVQFLLEELADRRRRDQERVDHVLDAFRNEEANNATRDEIEEGFAD